MPTQNAWEKVLDALNDLAERDFQRFIFHLKSPAVQPRVRAGEVDHRTRAEVTELLVSRCTESGAVDRTIQTLRAAGCNNQAQKLESRNKAHSKKPKSLIEPGPAPKPHKGPHETNNAPKKPQKVKNAAPKAKTLPKSEEDVLRFGKHEGRSFRWLLENDVAWAAFVVGSHQIERESGNSSQTPHMKHKDALAEYVSRFPDAVEAVHFFREGLAPVGFGKYKNVTRNDLYNSTEDKEQKYVQWLRSRKKTDGPEMEASIKYIRYRDENPNFFQLSSSRPQKASSSTKRAQPDTSAQPAAKKQSSSTLATPTNSIFSSSVQYFKVHCEAWWLLLLLLFLYLLLRA